MWDPTSKSIKVSSPALDPLKSFLEADKVDFLKHEGLFFEVGQRTSALLGAFIWNTTRWDPAAGWYDGLESGWVGSVVTWGGISQTLSHPSTPSAGGKAAAESDCGLMKMLRSTCAMACGWQLGWGGRARWLGSGLEAQRV